MADKTLAIHPKFEVRTHMLREERVTKGFQVGVEAKQAYLKEVNGLVWDEAPGLVELVRVDSNGPGPLLKYRIIARTVIP